MKTTQRLMSRIAAIAAGAATLASPLEGATYTGSGGLPCKVTMVTKYCGKDFHKNVLWNPTLTADPTIKMEINQSRGNYTTCKSVKSGATHNRSDPKSFKSIECISVRTVDNFDLYGNPEPGGQDVYNLKYTVTQLTCIDPC